MKLGLITGYAGRKVTIPLEAIKHAEKLGYDSVWTSEAYGSDAVTPATWMLANTSKIRVGTAIMQMAGRTPAMTAMTAMTLSQLSGNRFIVGIGASGPQVVEGWHGVPYGRPVTRLKEYVQIMRRIFAREDALSFDGREYQIPYQGGRQHRPRQAAQEHPALRAADPDLCGHADAGRGAGGRRGGRRFLPGVDGPGAVPRLPGAGRERPEDSGQDLVAVRHRPPSSPCPWATTSRPAWRRCARTWRSTSAAWAPRTRISTTTTPPASVSAAPAKQIQDLYLAGRKEEAAALVPDELIDACHLVGPAERIRDRAQRWIAAGKKGHVGSMLIRSEQPKVLELLAQTFL